MAPRKLKEEIFSNEVSASEPAPREQVAIKINSQFLLTFVLTILVIVSLWQTVQLAKMAQGVSGKTPTSTSEGNSGSQVPGTLKDVPSQVGGC